MFLYVCFFLCSSFFFFFCFLSFVFLLLLGEFVGFFWGGGGGHLFSLVVFFQNITLKTVGFLIIYQSFWGLEFGQRNRNVLFMVI